MLEKVNLNNIEFYETAFNPDDPLLREFFALRYNVYREFNLDYYKSPEPTAWDYSEGSYYLLIINKSESGEKQVVGGRRFIIHEPNTGIITYCEKNTGVDIYDMLPHLDPNPLRYAEFGSLAFHKSLRGTGASELMYAKSFEIMKRMEVDFILSSPVPHNVIRMQEEAMKNGAQQIVWRKDLVTKEDGDHDPTIFFSFKNEHELPLLSPEMKKNGIGLPPTEVEIRQLVASKEKPGQQK